MSREACIVAAGKFGDSYCLLKNRDRNYLPEVKVVHEVREGVEVAYLRDEFTGWVEGMNEHGVGIVNAALMVSRDESERDEVERTGKKLKDGERILKALTQKTVEAAAKSIRTYRGGLPGHTIISDGKTTLYVEMPDGNEIEYDEVPPDDLFVRTNHGIEFPDGGYVAGGQEKSSKARMREAEEVLAEVDSPDDVGPALLRARADRWEPTEMVRDNRSERRMRTTTQMVLDLTEQRLTVYLFPGRVEWKGVEDRMPEGREPKIDVRVLEYEDLSVDTDGEARVKTASYFNVGDEILYGKYKNKRGCIVAFGKDERGVPFIEVEPIPKGRKKNKIIGLFKVWHADPAKRVASRWVAASAPAAGTWFHGSRHLFDSFRTAVRETFGTGASEVPIFLTRDRSFARLHAGNHGFIYTVRARVKRTFDPDDLIRSNRYWPPQREDLTPEGQRLYDDLAENRIFPRAIRPDNDEDWHSVFGDSHGLFASILKQEYDVVETTEMKRWLRAQGYDSFYVGGDGPTNLAVFDPSDLEIVSVESVSGKEAANRCDHVGHSMAWPSPGRVAARYKDKKVVETKDGDERTVYIYSERQVQNRNREKAKRVEKLRHSISDLRKQVKKDLESDDPKTRLTALAVALIDATFERVGNDDSASEGHFGVTGWLKKHVTFGSKGGKATIRYVGKSGVKQEKVIEDAKLVKALKGCCEDKGPDDPILSFDDEGDTLRVTSREVNAYLKPFDVTAKDLRGFHANREMQDRLREIRRDGPELPRARKERDKILKDEFKKALEATAEAVGHEASTLRTQYLVPGMEDAYMKDGTVFTSMKQGTASASRVAAAFLEASRRIAMDIPAVGRRLQREVRPTWHRTYPIKGGEVEVRFYPPDARNPYAETYGKMLAWMGDEAVGWLNLNLASTFKSGEPGLVFDIEVSPEQRRRGIGAVLVRAAEEHSRMRVRPSSHVMERQPSQDAQHLWDHLTKRAIFPARWATKSDAEREDEEAERLIRNEPKKKPPRDDSRRERMKEPDPDLDGRDKDLSKNRKDTGG